VQVDVDHFGSSSFWIRDSVPIPVLMADGGFGAVDAKYYHKFNPDQAIAKKFELELIPFDAFFEGGNFLSDSKGRCFIVNNERVRSIPDQMFRESYGCASVHRFPHVRGIGHMDERLKFIKDDFALTDELSYMEELEKLGIRSKLLPRPEGLFRTYANAVTVNQIVFLPVFEQPSDFEAIEIFKQEGLTVIPILSKDLPEKALGNIHCITMTYPPVPMRGTLEN
jgi:agmatine/peptidylarginine deiminase